MALLFIKGINVAMKGGQVRLADFIEGVPGFLFQVGQMRVSISYISKSLVGHFEPASLVFGEVGDFSHLMKFWGSERKLRLRFWSAALVYSTQKIIYVGSSKKRNPLLARQPAHQTICNTSGQRPLWADKSFIRPFFAGRSQPFIISCPALCVCLSMKPRGLESQCGPINTTSIPKGILITLLFCAFLIATQSCNCVVVNSVFSGKSKITRHQPLFY